MLNKLILFFVACAMGNFVSMQAAETRTSKGSINWQTNYDEALRQARSSGKPILLFFTGSYWCSWCHKLEDESLNTSEFSQAVGDAFIFVKFDYPLYSQQDPQVKAANKKIQGDFNVRSFPSIIILDSQGNKIGTTGYRPGGGKSYANHLLKIVDDHSGYKQKMGSLDKQAGVELKALYEMARELGHEKDAEKIVKLGVDSDQSLFFLTEKYRTMVSKGRIHEKEAVDLRQHLLNADPTNENQTHYLVAVIDFEAYSEELENISPERAVSPLVEYMERFGSVDKDNLWRLQMLISQVYLDKNQMNKALNHAELSYKSAPQSAKQEISKAIQNIQSQLHSSNSLH